jgi:hypothetical protein
MPGRYIRQFWSDCARQVIKEIEDIEKVNWYNSEIKKNAKKHTYAKNEEDLIYSYSS